MSYKSNYKKVVKELDRKKKKALEAVGLFVEGESVVRCPVKTGNLKGSIDHKSGEDSVIIGTNVEYAPDVFLGTSKQRAQPTIRPAVEKNVRKIEKLIEEAYK